MRLRNMQPMQVMYEVKSPVAEIVRMMLKATVDYEPLANLLSIVLNKTCIAYPNLDEG